jgi:hypothetical protein
VQNKTLQQEGTGTNRVPNTERVLIADATVSKPDNGVTRDKYAANYDYINVDGWFYKDHLSPHLRGKIPDGGNLGFKDGHASWRKFDRMDQRAASARSFWW